MYIKKIFLEKIRCFKDIEISYDLSGDAPPWTVIVGDNAAGKTTLLRSIAIGLCDESNAAGLMKESDSGYVRDGEREGKIIIDLSEENNNYRIETTIEHIKTKNGYFERVRQRTTPSKFPWDNLFVAGYGAGRGTSGTGDIAGYSVINAVYNMFNYTEGLQNPELTILRLKKPDSQKEVREILEKLLTVNSIKWEKSGITVDGQWGKKMPLRDLADGYKSTFLWVTDFLGWAYSFDQKIETISKFKGIVIIDELEQHLHATWQRVLISQLKEHFPRIQFIVSTHSPLIAASVGNLDSRNDKLFICEPSDEDSTLVQIYEHETMQSYRFDQVLASRAFKYLIEENPALEEAIKRASILKDKGDKRTPKEEKEYKKLKEDLKGSPFLKATYSVQRENEEEELTELKRKEAEAENDQNNQG
jgi:predicted ATPase